MHRHDGGSPAVDIIYNISTVSTYLLCQGRDGEHDGGGDLQGQEDIRRQRVRLRLPRPLHHGRVRGQLHCQGLGCLNFGIDTLCDEDTIFSEGILVL